LGGLAAVVGGVLLFIADLIDFFAFDPEENLSEVVTAASYAFIQVLNMLGIVLVLCGLVGLYARQSEAAGVLGLVGFVVALAGTVLDSGLLWTSLFAAPSAAIAAPGFVDAEFTGSLALGLPLTFITFGLGWLLFGVASLRAGVYPRIPAIVLIIGAVLTSFPLPLVGLVIDVAVAWLGFSLLTGRDASAGQPAGAR
jgi:hypothetical protein